MTTGFKLQTGQLMSIHEKFKGYFATGQPVRKPRNFYYGEHSWTKRCQYAEEIVQRHPLAKSQILTIAGQLMADGVFTEAAHTEGPHAKRSEEAKDIIDDFNRQIGLDTLLYDTAVNMGKLGSCFWEKTETPIFDVEMFSKQETIEPAAQDENGLITAWRQDKVTWNTDQIIHFPWNITAFSWPYGTTLFSGLGQVFEILEQMQVDIQEFMHHAAFPYELWQVGNGEYVPLGTEIDTIRAAIKNWSPGEHHVTSYPIELKTGGTGDKSITNLNEILDFLYNECIDGLMMPPISKQYNSTEASAKEMMPWARANLIQPMQRIIKRKIENELYKPYLESLGYSVKVCPHLSFESPDANKLEEMEYWMGAVQSNIVPPLYAAEQLGFDVEKIEKMQQDEMDRQMEQFQLQKVMQPQGEKTESESNLP